MKVTIRGVDPKIWEATRVQAILEKKTVGEMVNEGLKLRQEQKAVKSGTKHS